MSKIAKICYKYVCNDDFTWVFFPFFEMKKHLDTLQKKL